MKVIKSGASKAFDALLKGELDVAAGDMKVRTHRIAVGFNVPSDPGFKAKVSIFPGGKSQNEIYDELSKVYYDTLEDVNEDSHLYTFGQIRLKNVENKGDLVTKLQENYDFIKNEILANEQPDWRYNFKVFEDGDDICLGLFVPLPKHTFERKVLNVQYNDLLNNGQWFNRIAAVLELMKGADTGIHAEVNLGANIKDILESE